MTQRLAIPALLLLLLSAAFFQLGCDSADNPIAPSGSTLSISANPTLISLSGQSAALTITGFKPDGNPLNPNTQLTISTSLGVLRAANNINSASINIVTTNESGRATAYLFGDGRQGTATVTVSLTSGTDATESTVDVQIGDDASSQPVVTVTANPMSIELNETSTITVTAKNPDQSPLAGAEAIVRTSLGTLAPSGALITDSNGVATVTLRSNVSGTATVTASVDSSAEESVDVEIGTSTTKPILEISVNPSTVDSGDDATVSLTVLDENRNLINENREVFLDVDEGTLRTSAGGTPFTSGSISVRGRGTLIYTAGQTAGSATISGIVGNSDRATATVTIRTAPATITIQANPTTIDRDPETTDSITLTARVLDEIGDPLGGEIVTFIIDDGSPTAALPASLNPPQGSTTGPDGVATATLDFSGEVIGDSITLITVTARVRDLSTEDPAEISVTGN